MTDPYLTLATEELGYFYDTIHGRIALEELPQKFLPALKSALSSKTLARLKRIGQLGHTSVSFFSATHTRFSHAIGTMLVMNRLFGHVAKSGLPPELFEEIKRHYPRAVESFGDERTMVHCHLLLAALYQDGGELPFQKVTSLYFTPVESELGILVDCLPKASPKRWNSKKVFSVLSLLEDMGDAEVKEGLRMYDREFLAFLMTSDGAPVGTNAIWALIQMVDGVIDADRLDYVYRDASVTIGGLSRPSTVLESIVAYRPGMVIVNDPRPATDFLSTRMRLWTFVYSSADVRFRQALLKTVMEGRWDRNQAEAAFGAANLDPELTHLKFRALDDNSLMERVDKLDPTHLEPYRKEARTLLLRGTLDYECRVLKRVVGMATVDQPDALPKEIFFDLLSDHGHHQLYRPESVFVRQGLTSRIGTLVPLEHSAGAFSPLFSGSNSAMLVPDGFYLFLPRDKPIGHRWNQTLEAIEKGIMFPVVAWEDARRGLACPSDTRGTPDFNGLTISISYCSKDFTTVVRIVRELYRLKRRYWLFLRPFDGTGGTSAGNSERLVSKAESVLAVVSTDYLQRALDGSSHVAIEVRTMHGRAKVLPIVPIGVDERDKLNAVEGWNWGQLNENWRGEKAVIPNSHPLRDASQETVGLAVHEALKQIDEWRAQS